jgi:predicted outer membrane repeat protein
MYSESSATVILCKSTVRVSFENIERVFIRNIIFIGCGGNVVKDIDNFTLQETTFEGRDDSETALTLMNTAAKIIDCTFARNQFGTAIDGVRALILLTTDINWFLVGDVTGVIRIGGALISSYSNITINGTTFEDNKAETGGDIFTENSSKISIFNSTFTGDGLMTDRDAKEAPFAGAIFSLEGEFLIEDCRFRRKNATVGGAIVSALSTFTIINSTFLLNSATDHGASVFAHRSTVFVSECDFERNCAGAGAGIATQEGRISVNASRFIDNVVVRHAAALDFYKDSPIISGCVFVNNVAHSFAGAVLFWFSDGIIYAKTTPEGGVQPCNDTISMRCNNNATDYEGLVDYDSSHFATGEKTIFVSNSAPTGAAIYVIKSTVRNCGPILFLKNHVTRNSVVYFLDSNGTFEGTTEMSQNVGSFFGFNSDLIFSGCSRFTKGSPPQNTSTDLNEGGALTLVQTTLTLRGESRFEHNFAEIGGAIVATESEVRLQDEVLVSNNRASNSGGGFYLSQSDLHSYRRSRVTISNNVAVGKGGAVHAVSSSIKGTVTGIKEEKYDGNSATTEEYLGSLVYIVNNRAGHGGALFLEANSKVTLLKDYIFETEMNVSALNFIGNSAELGGAIYVDDESNSGACASNPFERNSINSECFVRVVATHTILTANTNYSLNNIDFDSNSANVSGSTLFGGLLDRCRVSLFNEVDRTIDLTDNQFLTYKGDGLQYLFDISTGNSKQTISSFPVQLCQCVNNQPVCGYKVHSDASVRRGETFTVSVMAVDHVYSPANATIQGYLSSTASNLISGQVTPISNRCTNVSFQITSPRDSELLTLYASDGPCKDAALSQLKVNVAFLPCTCPIGFQQRFRSSFCSCTCHRRLRPFVGSCNRTARTFRRNINVWISYVNDSHSSGYLVHQYCPFDYCVPPNASQPLNLETSPDTQCALNRTGMLCGACKPGLSLSLGSSRCLECPNYWPVFFVVITIFSFLAGLGLVALILWLNMTVAVGTLNGLLFYANIVSANRVVLLPYPEPNLITVFISWLNLELGIDVCYIKGMDIYIRTWLQLTFPIYIILLVVLLIVVSRYSSRFSSLISKRDPIATLATLILISYGKLFHVVLLAQPFSFATLRFPNNATEVLWLPDGTVRYLTGKHIVLFIVALLILAVCVGYGLLLFCWQLILRLPDWKIFRCFRNPNFNLFMAAYHIPYAPRHRYWTGMLLLARAILYLVAAANVSGDPQIQLISVTFVVIAIILLKMFIAVRLFKNWVVDALESFFYVNIVCFAAFTSFNLSRGNSQDAVAYLSVCLSILVTVIIVLYHFYKYTSLFSLCKEKYAKKISKRFKSPSRKRTVVEASSTAITDDSIRRYDDIMDLSDYSTSETDYHFIASPESIIGSPRKPTYSVIELN